jgi:Cytochrome c554 and c-prime
MKGLGRALAGVAVLAAVGVAVLGGTSWYYGGEDGRGCARCHEIRPMVETWASSSHRKVGCKDCHGSSLSADLRMHAKNLERVWLHARGESPEQIHLRHGDVAPLVARCAACHAQEAADWASGPHGVSYAAIFLDPKHNASQQLMDDCLRCHAMHFEGGIRDLVAPLDRKGPWRLVHESDAGLPAVPCFACHAVHRQGAPFATRSDRAAVEARDQEVATPSLAFYDRRALGHVGLDRLPMPVMRDGDRVVRMSPDGRQALCYQCHAPRAGSQVFSGDDRTPVGVHEGLSCGACHAKHGQTTRASCAACHPRLSNCGIDVETMDTTFRSRASSHDVHRVACLDCHPRGVPAKRRAASARR